MSLTSATSDQPDGSQPDPGAVVVVPPLVPKFRERSIPIRTGDLARLILAEPGLSDEERTQLDQLGRMIRSVFHFEFQAKLEELKELYAPLDPDSDCVSIL